VPVCQEVPAAPVDARGVAAFCAALAPVALDGSTQAIAAQRPQPEQREAASRQQRERWRYAAALRALQTPEAAAAQRAPATAPAADTLSPAVRAALLDIGAPLPDR
jgi:hypothetical protein